MMKWKATKERKTAGAGRLLWCLISVAAVWMPAAVCSFALPVEAAETERIFDQASLLTEDEISEIASKVSELEEKSGWEVFVLTTENAQGSSTAEYSEKFLDGSLSGDDGIVYTIDMDNREVYLATTGMAIYYLTDDRIDQIIDSGYDAVADGNYGTAFLNMIDTTVTWYEAGIPSDQYTYDTDTGEIVTYVEPKSLRLYEIFLAAIIAAGAFVLIFFVVLGKYRLKWGGYQYDFHENSRVTIRNEQDRFVNQLVTHHSIPRNSSNGGRSGGGRSSVHTGRGGRSYGGGGRRF